MGCGPQIKGAPGQRCPVTRPAAPSEGHTRLISYPSRPSRAGTLGCCPPDWPSHLGPLLASPSDAQTPHSQEPHVRVTHPWVAVTLMPWTDMPSSTFNSARPQSIWKDQNPQQACGWPSPKVWGLSWGVVGFTQQCAGTCQTVLEGVCGTRDPPGSLTCKSSPLYDLWSPRSLFWFRDHIWQCSWLTLGSASGITPGGPGIQPGLVVYNVSTRSMPSLSVSPTPPANSLNPKDRLPDAF